MFELSCFFKQSMKIPMGIPEWGILDLLSVMSRSITYFKELNILLIAFHKVFNADLNSIILTDLGRQAIYLALKALDVKPSDEVIIPSYACSNIILPVISAGCTPIFADCESDLNISISHVKQLINQNTKAIIVPHLYGKIAQIEEFSQLADKKEIYLIDDAAQAFGAKLGHKYVGTFGDFGIFSFGPFKSITATRGGALIINKNKELKTINISNINIYNSISIAFKCWIKFKLRRYSYSLINKKSKNFKLPLISNSDLSLKETIPYAMSKIDIGIIAKMISKTDTIIEKRKEAAKYLSSLIRSRGEKYFLLPDNSQNNIFVKYILLLKSEFIYKQQQFILYLLKNGIEAHGGYYPLHLNHLFKKYAVNSLPFTEKIWNAVVCLPLYSSIKIKEIEYMAKVINNFNWEDINKRS